MTSPRILTEDEVDEILGEIAWRTSEERSGDIIIETDEDLDAIFE